MKAWLLDEQAPVTERPMRFGNVPDPVPGSGEVAVAVAACGVCRTDLHVVEGDLPLRATPITPGHQVVGDVVAHGEGVREPALGTRVGVAWLHDVCGTCPACASGRENLCDRSEFTGWTRPGGYAERIVAPAGFVYPLPPELSAVQAAPLLCAGIIGYRAMRLCGIDDWSGRRLGIYGFGAAGHVAIQIARARGAEVYVMTRDRIKHRTLARELGAAWVGDTTAQPPAPLDASIVFAPAGEIVPPALAALAKGGTLVLGGIHMSPIPEIAYELLYHERSIRTVANNTRVDGREFLAEAARVPVVTHTEGFPLERADDALIALANDAIKGAAVLAVS